jgi:hypothetical protein
LANKPSFSPWGRIQNYKTHYPGVYTVSTEEHGGIMVNADIANKLLSPTALKCGFLERGYICFEEDCQAAVVIKEMLDKNLWKIPKYYTEGKEKYSEMINASLIQWNPEYWEETGNTLPFDALKKRLMERLSQNFSEYCDVLVERNKNEPDFKNVINNSYEIAAVNDAYSYLTEGHSFEIHELEYLLKFQNPLMVVADDWPELKDMIEADCVIHEICDKEDALNSGAYELMNVLSGDKKSPHRDTPVKSSILGQVKENQETIKNNGGDPKAAKKEKTEVLE